MRAEQDREQGRFTENRETTPQELRERHAAALLGARLSMFKLRQAIDALESPEIERTAQATADLLDLTRALSALLGER